MATVEPDNASLQRNRHSFGRDVLGPILARFSRDLILYARSTPNPADTAILFASRGGWRLELATQLFATRTGYDFGGAITGRLMISRLLAMRAYLLTSDSAVEELARYSDGKTLGFVASLLSPPETVLPSTSLLNEPVTIDGIRRLVADNSELGRLLRADLNNQHALVNAHLDELRAGRRNVLFVDTGLFGSMFRTLDDGRPDLETALIMLGRCFYRTPLPYQRSRSFGLAFQTDRFRHSAPESSVIRHWYLFETMFEPPMPSITRLDALNDSNLPDTSPMNSPAVAERDNPFFAGIRDYIEALSAADLIAIDTAADCAANRLARAILMPSATDVTVLGIGPSEASPGDDDGMNSLIAIDGASFSQKLASVRDAHWQEGQARRAFPVSARLMLPAVALARIAAGIR